MARLTQEQLERLREEFPEAYEERLQLVDLHARLWNALVWFSDTTTNKFRGRLLRLARDLRDEAKEGKPDGYTTQMDHEVRAMEKAGWGEGYSGC